MEQAGDTMGRRTTGRRVRKLPRAVARWLSAHRPLIGAGMAILLGGLAATAGYSRDRRGGVAANDRSAMARATAAADSLERLAWLDELSHTTTPSLDDDGVLALGYLARAALGTGSPFRLAEFALRDPRLPAALGRTVAWAVLARTAQDSGLVYATDATAFRAATGIGPIPVSRHRALIDSVVFGEDDARTGEAAVRIGYSLAVAEGTLSGSAATVATRVAAQVRDRRLAREDALRLLRASAADHEDTPDALALLVRWRADRRFAVEAPLLSAALRPDEAAAVRAGVALRDELRRETDAAERVVPDSSGVGRESTTIAESAPTLLPPRTARRLAELPSVRGGPPEAPVAVAAAAYRRQLERDATRRVADGDSVAARGAALAGVRRRFADRVRSEETLVAELGLAAQTPVGTPPDVAGVALAAAVSMRPFAQDTLLPIADPRGTNAATATPEALVARFGLRTVTFDASVPAAWRPYHLAQLAAALEDLRTVLPWAEFDGLAVRVGESAKRDSALALHDPSSRTLYLPAASGAGTIAHELAHDLDWQTARTRLAVRGTYSTDRLVRTQGNGGTLAVAVRGLTAARPRNAPAGSGGSPERPAELFARGVDWYVATALAAAGRSNGALSAVQDEALAGYAGVVPPEAGDGVADALVRLLGDMTVVPPVSRDRFLARWGMTGAPSALSLVRSTWSTMPWWGTERAIRSFGLTMPLSCVTEPAAKATAGTWRSALLGAAAESRARGMLRSRGRQWAAPARWSWEARSTLGGPWNPALGDSAVARTRDALLRAIVWDDAARHPLVDGDVAVLGDEALRACR
ncbi:hypothetical protein J421_1176 [Gemmatirosa kalamazoonensis]|uniref:Uncharacterized protein n=1 Tax=Gemmatirosa kalamazoonensis TaxID=861299 RepID=W0RH57_9BACT|nr:hypothetical protein J421_1176 [Gemmatirosa kalamazoonensis]